MKSSIRGVGGLWCSPLLVNQNSENALQIFPYTSPCSCFLSRHLFFNCYTRVCVVVCSKCINTTCPVRIMLFVCIFSGLTVWNWITNGLFLPGEDCLSCSRHPLQPVVLHIGLRPPGLSPVHTSRPIRVSFFRSCFHSHVGETSRA